jgi:glycosyltransferase involved in cell wall biosynthesis
MTDKVNPETNNNMDPATISAVIIAQDEADRINRLLDSLEFVDEIIVVDSGSTDGTQRICQDAGAKLFNHTWQGFAAQKQFAMELATCEWILNLDADEAVSTELAIEIQSCMRSRLKNIHGYAMPRLSRYLGRWIRHGGWYPDRKVRLVRNGKARWQTTDLHEQLVVDGHIGRLNAPLKHYVYRNISDQVQTIDRYSDIHAGARRPARSVFVAVGMIHAIVKFFECYLWKLGFLDGIPGLIIAMNSSWYVFLRHAKTWERGLTNQGET